MKVVAFNGSPRKKGNTSALLNLVLDELKKEGIETELVQIGGTPIHGCRACFKCMTNQDQRCSQDDDVHAISSIHHMMLMNEMIVPGSSYWNMAVGFGAGDVEKDDEGIATMKTLGQNMAWLLKKLKS